MTHRLENMGHAKYAGLTVLNGKGKRHFNGVVRTVEDALTVPLKRKKPTVWFVNSMSDLFHKDVPFEFIDKVFAVMALTPRHTYQILTKQPERMAEYLNDRSNLINAPDVSFSEYLDSSLAGAAREMAALAGSKLPGNSPIMFFNNDAEADKYNYVARQPGWPLPNAWLGASVEDQEQADKRIPHLLNCPAAVRFLSCEPLLGPVDLMPHIGHMTEDKATGELQNQLIDWVIVGGESGGGARPCDVEWIRSIVSQCKAAGVPCFVKQLGKVPTWAGMAPPRVFLDKKGGDIDEWPEDLRVREYPTPLAALEAKEPAKRTSGDKYGK
jgi:protein gp37